MSVEEQAESHIEPIETQPVGKWTIFGQQTVTPALTALVDGFEPLENPGGREAARWLKEEALGQDRLTRTHLLLSEAEDKVLGYFSCCYSQVRLTEKNILSLGLRTRRTTVPAFLMCWVARRAEERVGPDLMATAYGLAQEAGEKIGLVAFVVDPLDEAIASVWRAAPYYFQESDTRIRKDGPARLWLPT